MQRRVSLFYRAEKVITTTGMHILVTRSAWQIGTLCHEHRWHSVCEEAHALYADWKGTDSVPNAGCSAWDE